MKILLLFTLFSMPLIAFGQKLYVEKSEGNPEQPIINKLIESNYKLTFKPDSADYTLRLMITNKRMGSAKGYMIITSTKTGEIISKSREYGAAATSLNLYKNPGVTIAKKISDKELVKMLSKL